RTRLQVLQKVVAAHQGVEEAKVTATRAEADLSRLRRAAGAVAREVIDRAEVAVAQAKSKLATAQAELDYLLGKPAARKKEGAGRSGAGTVIGDLDNDGVVDIMIAHGLARLAASKRLGESVAGPAADRLRKALDRKVTVKCDDCTAGELLVTLRKEASGLHIQAALKGIEWSEKVSATLTDVPLGAALQLLEDVLASHRIVVREYGFLIVPQDKVPPGAGPLNDFWRGAGKSSSAGAAGPDLRGEVRQVDGNLVKISLGSDAGLAKGQTMEVFRLGATPRYIGRVRIVEVTPTHAVGQVTGRLAMPVRVGDQGASRIRDSDKVGVPKAED